MTNTPTQMSVVDLEKLLSSRKSELNDLYKERDKLQRDLERVNYRIGALGGANLEDGQSPYLSRPRNSKSLRKHVLEILGSARNGLSLSDLAEKVLEAGYRTSSANFKNVLYQCLYNTIEIVHDEESGTYKIQTAKRKAAKSK